MAQYVQVDNLNGLFKEVYASKVKDLVPEGVKLFNLVPFMSSEKQLGGTYH